MSQINVLRGISGNNRKRSYDFFLAAVQHPGVPDALLVRAAK